MSTDTSLHSCWDTACQGRSAEMSLQERSALGEHLHLCDDLRSPWQSLQVGAAEVQGVLAGRAITSVLVLLVLMGGSWLML